MARRMTLMEVTLVFDVSTGTPVPAAKARVQGTVGDPAGATVYEKVDRQLSNTFDFDPTRTGAQLAIDGRNAIRALFQ